MARSGFPAQPRDPRMTGLRILAGAVATLSGACALAALIFGSPLQFGVALASCAAACIAGDYVRVTVERQRATSRCAVPAASMSARHQSCRVVHVGGAERRRDLWFSPAPLRALAPAMPTVASSSSPR